MNKWRLSASVFLMSVAYSATALAGVYYYQITGESYGRTASEAIDNAVRVADEKCYKSWGRSSQEYTVLDQWVDSESGYPHARVSLECAIED